MLTRSARFWLAAVAIAALWGGVSNPSWSASPRQETNRREGAPATPPRPTNRLIHEKSPYLLQHAHNPVDWYPWGQEAFAKARREQKPIFLSIGYSTCHWCHVMERESFSSPAIAEILNRHFVAIKVDREERPDVDQVYMSFVEATTSSGGWPLSVFLTPDLKPFFGGTYFPPEDRNGLPGLRRLLLRIAAIWQKNRAQILTSADQATEQLHALAQADTTQTASPQAVILEKTYRQTRASYDGRYGGFGHAPKFPRPVALYFLLRYYARANEKPALEMTLATLRAMARGGIHDQIGGGFHRYSTDERWFMPHFEKMLYDQAQLSIAYLEAYQVTREPLFPETARDILDYILRDLRGPEGAFYSAEDADSLMARGRTERGEGAFYVWTAREINERLGADAPIFEFFYGVEASGNVPAAQDARNEFEGKNILFARHSVAETARQFGRTEREIRSTLAASRAKLLRARSERPRPPRDDKVLTAWNGLMISALARSAQVLDDARYLAAAQNAARFIRAKLFDRKSGRLWRRYRAGNVAIHGFVDDYAFFIQGLLDLYEASFDFTWLTWAVQLQEKQDELFWDAQHGGYRATSGEDRSILVRLRNDYDGAEPSTNSVAAMNLLRLAQMTDRRAWREKAERTLAAFGRQMERSPESLPLMAAALDFSLSKPKQIIIAGDPDATDTRALLRLVHERFLPNKILLLADGGPAQTQLARWLPFVENVRRMQGRATAYICENYVCKLPTNDPQKVARLLGESSAGAR